MTHVSDIAKQLGYAGKNYGKMTNGHCWTRHGVVRVGVFTNAENFVIEHINVVKTDIMAELSNITGAVQSALESDSDLLRKVLRVA